MTEDLDPDELYGDPEADEVEDSESASWLQLIKDYQKVFGEYDARSEKIARAFADGEHLAKSSRDNEFQIFWANIQVLKTTVYNRPPIPVVTPRFRDRRPLFRTASELLERVITVNLELEKLDETLLTIRDDMVVFARGVPWLRREDKKIAGGKTSQRVCVDWVHSRDFAHDPARTWSEVDWVARRSFLTRMECKKRFKDYSGSLWQDAQYSIRKDDNASGYTDGKEKAAIWEIWCKSANRVVWVTEGVDEVLDSNEPHLVLDDFFPCIKPAYGTLQLGTLKPVADYNQYVDQINEVNTLTNRITALSNALRVKGFYPAGADELGDAIEAAIKNSDDEAILVPVANWAMVGSAPDKTIVWLPIEQVAATLTSIIALRKEIIQDIYEISGLSDIMRGSTDPDETLGAQELKTQYGSVRTRSYQNEMIRVARDIVRNVGEIVAEEFSVETLMGMSQMEIPTNADIKRKQAPLIKQIQQITQQAIAAAQSPEAMAAQNPEQAQQMLMQAKQQIDKLQEEVNKLGEMPTVEKVYQFLKDERLRPYVLDIETDSTISPNEDAQKKRATEFVTAVGGYMNSAYQFVMAVPQSAKLFSETLKWVASQFRAGRMLEGVIDEFADTMAQAAGQPKPNPEAEAMQAKLKMEQEKHQQSMAKEQQAAQLAKDAAEHDAALKERMTAQTMSHAEQKHKMEIDRHNAEMARGAQQHEQTIAKGQQDMSAATQGDPLEERRIAIEERSASLKDEKLVQEIEALKANAAPAEAAAEMVQATAAAIDGVTKAAQSMSHAASIIAAAVAAPKRVIRNGREIVGVETVGVRAN